jgi:hypothetical protein
MTSAWLHIRFLLQLRPGDLGTARLSTGPDCLPVGRERVGRDAGRMENGRRNG